MTRRQLIAVLIAIGILPVALWWPIKRTEVVDETPSPAVYKSSYPDSSGYEIGASVKRGSGVMLGELRSIVTLPSGISRLVEMEAVDPAANPSHFSGMLSTGWTGRRLGACGFTVQHTLLAKIFGYSFQKSSSPRQIEPNPDDEGILITAQYDSTYFKFPVGVTALTVRELPTTRNVSIANFYPGSPLTLEETSLTCSGLSCGAAGIVNISLPTSSRALACGEGAAVTFDCSNDGATLPATGQVVFKTSRGTITVPFVCIDIGG